MNSPFAPMPPRDLAKAAINIAIGYKVQDTAARAIVDNTSLEEDSKSVRFGTTLLGVYVATKLDPITEKVVDTTFDFVIAQRNKRRERNNKKNNTEEK